MDLTFTKTGGMYVAEFDVTADFNLHLEGIQVENITIMQKGAGNGYDVVRNIPKTPGISNNFDFDFSALVYPKRIKVVSKVEPSLAVVTISQ